MLMYRILVELIHCGNIIGNCLIGCMKRILSTIKGYYYDKKLGDIDTGCSFIDSFTQDKYKDSALYDPAGYGTIRELINYLNLKENDIFVDFGCGKGRVIFAIATQKSKKVIGIEINKKLTDIAKANLGKLKLNNTHIEIINIDASNFDPKEGTIFFMYNPFGYKTIKEVLNNIKNSLTLYPRKICIAYYNSVFKDILNEEDWLIAKGEINGTHIFVWHNK